MKVLIVEDGMEYLEFATVFLRDWETRRAGNADEALRMLGAWTPDALLIDLRFERAAEETLLGEVGATADRLFGGDRIRARHYLEDNQGALILAEIRRAGHHQPALFVNDMPERRLANLQRLYGDVRAVPGFDAAAMQRALRT